MERLIYLDNSASTKISDEALERYNEVSKALWGNPSSLHSMGFSSEREIRASADTLLETLGAKGHELVFTASGTEANNLAILGRAFSKKRYKNGAKIITTKGEHASVSSPLSMLSELGFRIAEIPTVGGEIDFEALEKELDPSVILVSVMLVNNETGALYDTAKAAALMKKRSPEAVLHVDATQGYLKLKFTKQSIGADMITVSSHKIEGPKGVGALIIDQKLIKTRGISPVIFGGGQGGGLRSGTENVPGISAFARAADIGYRKLAENAEKTNALREHLIERLKEDTLSEIKPTLPEKHAPHIINITLPDIKSETMLHFLSSLGIFVSSGSACSSNSRNVSSALTAYGKTEKEADSSLRISFSQRNEISDVDALAEALSQGLSKLSRIRR